MNFRESCSSTSCCFIVKFMRLHRFNLCLCCTHGIRMMREIACWLFPDGLSEEESRLVTDQAISVSLPCLTDKVVGAAASSAGQSKQSKSPAYPWPRDMTFIPKYTATWPVPSALLHPCLLTARSLSASLLLSHSELGAAVSTGQINALVCCSFSERFWCCLHFWHSPLIRYFT